MPYSSTLELFGNLHLPGDFLANVDYDMSLWVTSNGCVGFNIDEIARQWPLSMGLQGWISTRHYGM